MRCRLYLGNDVLKLEIRRHLSPTVAGKLRRALPVDSFAYRKDSSLFVKLDLGVGGIRNVKELTRGDLFYDLLHKALGIALSDASASSSQIKVGKVEGGIAAAESVVGVTPVRLAPSSGSWSSQPV